MFYADVITNDTMSADFRDVAESWLAYRYHFDMLNDTERNDAYYAALARIVKPTDVVVDIGSGSGLLVHCCADGAVCVARSIFVSLRYVLKFAAGIDGSEVWCERGRCDRSHPGTRRIGF
jgi:hypothetical protein